MSSRALRDPRDAPFPPAHELQQPLRRVRRFALRLRRRVRLIRAAVDRRVAALAALAALAASADVAAVDPGATLTPWRGIIAADDV